MFGERKDSIGSETIARGEVSGGGASKAKQSAFQFRLSYGSSVCTWQRPKHLPLETTRSEPMTVLDPRSIIVMSSLTSGLMAVVLYFMRRSYPRHIGGLGYWASATAIWFFAAALFGSRGRGLPDFVVVLMPNVMLLVGALLYYMGCRTFFGQETRWRPWILLLVLFTLGFAWWLYGQRSYTGRLFLLATTVFLLYSANFWVLLRHGGKRLPVRLVETFLVLQMVVLLWRMITAPADMTADRMYEQTFIQVVYLGSYTLTHFFLTVGAVLMATDRLVTELEGLAQKDSLTQLPNRRTLFERMDNEIARSQRSGRGPALLMFDLDHFKSINDTQGHQQGDKVLTHFTQTLKTQLRKTDIVGRYGGEEFMGMLPETDLETALQITQRIHEVTNSNHPMACQVSIGLATWRGHEDTLEALIARADSAVYEAKKQGRNRTCTA